MRTEFQLAVAQLRAIADALEAADEGDASSTVNIHGDDFWHMTIRRLHGGTPGYSFSASGYDAAGVIDLTLRAEGER